MVQRFQLKRGFLKLQRLGPVKFAEQSRWSARAPEPEGLWAFPYPHFDLFYAYHKYSDMGPKDFRTREPKDPKWYVTELDGSPIPSDALIEFRESNNSVFRAVREPYYRTESGELITLHLSSDYWAAQEKWINNVGKKILPLREFWYRGELYTHFTPSGEVGTWTMNSSEEGNYWSRMSTEKLAAIMKRPGSVLGSDGHRPDGKPATYRYSADHLEVFIPRGRGIIRDKL